MKELSFIRQNIDKWKSVERLIDEVATRNPAELADTYIEVAADLSFSRSHYPSSRITQYLNNLASALHNQLYKNKKEKYSRLWTYWTQEIPVVMAQSRKELLYSFLVFAGSVLIGVVSTLGDDTFVRLILGNGYVDMTLDNIESGDPVGVYSRMSELPMFLFIMYNNIRVSFTVFILGALTGFGTGWALFQNGVMLGTFQTFFFQHGVGVEATLAVWLHGVFEISAIVIAGAAGFALGNGWLFPGTYSRGYAFRQGAKRGVKITAGLIPVFIVAAFIESFLTRHTDYPAVARLSIIILSFALIVYYYILLPNKIYNERFKTKN
jgi:uncharacterized membrane protein SpoIIM required for sporulation